MAVGTLDRDAIDRVLRSQTVAHLGCVLPDGRPYVVPISYAYDGHALYSYSTDGDKLAALRAKPTACVAVDNITDAANWTSAVVWGTFQELADDEAADALRHISERLRTFAVADGSSPEAARTYVARNARDGVAYRIAITASSGRYSTSA